MKHLQDSGDRTHKMPLQKSTEQGKAEEICYRCYVPVCRYPEWAEAESGGFGFAFAFAFAPLGFGSCRQPHGHGVSNSDMSV